MKNILITAIGSMSAPHAIETLKEEGNIVFGTDIYPKEWIATANDVAKFFQVPKVGNSNKLFLFVLNICKTNKIGFVIPLTDIEIDYFSAYKSDFNKNEIILCCSNKKEIDVCRSKLNIFNIFKNNSQIQVIPTFSCETLDANSIDFPLMCKPDRGRSSEGVYVVSERYSFILNENKSYIYQPFVKGDIISVDVLFTQDKLISIARKELIRTKNGAGLTVEIFNDNTLNELVFSIAKTLGLIGVYNIEFIKTEKKYFLMDINPRFSAGVAFSNLAGYNFVKNHLNFFMEKEIDSLKQINCKIFKRKFVEL